MDKIRRGWVKNFLGTTHYALKPQYSKRVVIVAVVKIETWFVRIVSHGMCMVTFCRWEPQKRWITRSNENSTRGFHSAVANERDWVHDEEEKSLLQYGSDNRNEIFSISYLQTKQLGAFLSEWVSKGLWCCMNHTIWCYRWKTKNLDNGSLPQILEKE